MPRYPVLSSRDQLEAMIKSLPSLAAVAREIGCSSAAVIGAIKRHGIEYEADMGELARQNHAQKRQTNAPLLMNEKWLREQYDVQFKTVLEIAKLTDSSTNAVLNAFERYGIQTRSPAESRRQRGNTNGPRPEFPQLHDKEWVRSRYEDLKMSQAEIAGEIGCSRSIVIKALRRHGIACRPSSGPVGVTHRDRIPQLHDEDWLRLKFITENETASDMAESLGCEASAVYAALSRFGVTKFPDRLQGKQNDLPNGQKYKNGYIHVYQPNHPSRDNSGYVPQHRLIVEEAVGRLLTAVEEVHHINEVRTDNRLDNLMLMPSFREHVLLHKNPPPWVPRCECCDRSRPELVLARPAHVPLEFDREKCYAVFAEPLRVVESPTADA